MARQLNRFLKNHFGDALISEEQEHALCAAWYRHPKLAALPWWRIDSTWKLPTPYGTLKVTNTFGKCRCVARQGAELVQCSSGQPVVFRSVTAAKVAAIYHVSNGFGHAPAIANGCRWNLPQWICSAAIPQQACCANPTDILPDEYEAEPERLNDFLDEFCGNRPVADLLLLGEIHGKERAWSLRPPTWSNPVIGWHSLSTPYGILTAQRFFAGWRVRRSASLLVWTNNEQPVVYCNLRDAKIAALVHMHDYGLNRVNDSTRWA